MAAKRMVSSHSLNMRWLTSWRRGTYCLIARHPERSFSSALKPTLDQHQNNESFGQLYVSSSYAFQDVSKPILCSLITKGTVLDFAFHSHQIAEVCRLPASRFPACVTFLHPSSQTTSAFFRWPSFSHISTNLSTKLLYKSEVLTLNQPLLG